MTEYWGGAPSSSARKTQRLLPYPDGAAELACNLERLHLILRYAVARFRSTRGQSVSPGLGGVTVSDAEIDQFLSAVPWPLSESRGNGLSDEGSIEELRNAIAVERLNCELRAQASSLNSIDLPLARLARRLRLSSVELDICLLCLAAELHPGYGRLYAYLHDDITRTNPSIGLVMHALADDWHARLALRQILSGESALMRSGVIVVSARRDGVLNHELALDASVLDLLLGAALPRSLMESICNGPSLETLIIDIAERDSLLKLRAALSANESDGQLTAVLLRGPDGVGRRTIAAAICSMSRRSLFVYRCQDSDPGIASGLAGWLREVRLADGCPAIYLSTQTVADKAVSRAISESLALSDCRFAFLLADEDALLPADLRENVHVITIDLKTPRAGMRREAWARFLHQERIEYDKDDVASIASVYPFTIGRICRAVHESVSSLRWEDADARRVDVHRLAAACRAQISHHLDQLAERLPARHEWNDLVLPADELQRLREIANAVRNREQVMERWAFADKVSSGPGINALFFGPSGTGKTMAAAIVARDLGMEIYRVDLSRIVSKYIGETEKNLDLLFDEARRAFSLIFFDEAEALFGKRSEVKDAHDRYSNIELAYLLQRMEAFEGVAILATNLRKNMDNAFLRRLQFAVEFPLPSFKQRLLIWQRVWPPAAQLAPGLDLEFMAQNFELAGGYIRNIALTAAYFAAQERATISMKHLIMATRREFQKLGRVCVEDQFGKYGQLFREASRK
jgi:hypothetical protein